MTLFKTLRAASAVAAIAAAALFSSPDTARAQDTPLIGQMMLFAGNFCPRSWTAADGKLLSIASNNAMFAIVGTMYGGDGRTTFGVPDLRGRVPLSVGTGPGLPNPGSQGTKGGIATKTLSIPEMPSHSHMVNGNNSANGYADRTAPGNDFLGVPNINETAPSGEDLAIYSDQTPNVQMDPRMIANTGGSQPFSIQNPYQVMQWCIATQGIFPSRN